MLQDAGLIEQKEGRLELTPKGVRKIGSERAARPVRQARQGQSRPAPDGPARPGPRANLRNQAVRVRRPLQPRPAQDHSQRPPSQRHWTPVQPSPDDFEIEKTEHSRIVDGPDARPSLSIDVRQLPSGEEGRDGVALADPSQFPRDYMGIVGFSETARDPHGRAAARGVVGLRVRHQHAARLPAGAAAAGQADRHQADHHDHRRRADRAHHAARRRVLQLPAGARDRSRRPCAR